LCFIASLCLLTPAFAGVVYTNDFESNDAVGWVSSYKQADKQIGADSAASPAHFLGLFGDYAQPDPTDSFDYGVYFNGNNNSTNPDQWIGETATLTLAGNGAGWYNVTFDFYTINSWDGNNDCGPDTFHFAVNGVERVSGWFASNGDNSAGLTDQDSALIFYDNRGNLIGSRLYTISVDFLHSGGNMVFDFTGIPNQPDQENGDSGFVDEPWALDNVLISTLQTPAVPEPASLMLVGIGLAGVARLRRKGAQAR